MTDFHASLSAALDRQDGDVEALAEVWRQHEPDQYDCDNEALVCSNPAHLAHALLVSDWFAARLAEARTEGAQTVLGAVEALHRPDGGIEGPGAMCVYCTPDFGGPAEDPVPWPCATLDAVRDAARIARSEAGA